MDSADAADSADSGLDIVLIGPTGVGKTTVAGLLARRLGLPRWSVDELAGPYFAEVGLTPELYGQIEEEQGFLAAYRRWWPGFLHAARRLLEDHPRGVVDLGAAHTHYEDPRLFAEVRRALAPRRHVVLLLPSPDPERSVAILRERSAREQGWEWRVDGYDFIERWVFDPCNAELATLTVYTEGRTPEETCAEILAAVGAG